MADATPLPYSAPIAEATRLTGVSAAELYRMLGDGRIKGKKRGRSMLILMDTLREHIDSLPDAKIKPAPKPGRETATA